MSPSPVAGVVPILVTPFDNGGQIDEDSLTSLVEYNIAAGVHGLGVAIGSEMFKFNEAERDQVTKCVIKAAKGRVPVIINSGAAGTDLAVYYSKVAEAAGADALMVIPPSFMPVGTAETLDYYRRISEAVTLPIFLQDVPQAPVSPAIALRLAQQYENIKYIKVETLPVTTRVAEMVAAAGNNLTVFGGAGGSYFIEEMARGSKGTMPFCSQPLAFVEVWNRYQAGDLRGARTIFDTRIMAVNRLASQGGDMFYHMHKQLLVRLGVIRSAHVRSPTIAIDTISQREIDALLEQLVTV